MKKIIFVAALTMMISLASCGKVESREANNSLIRNQRIITEEINQDISFKNDESHLELEDNSSRAEEDSSEIEDNSSKMNDGSSRAVIVLEEDSSCFREEEKEENNVSCSNADITILDSCSSSNPVLGEKIKPEMGLPPVDKEPTLGEDKIQIAGCSAPQNTEVIVFKPSTHYLHRSTCHWVDDECYEISDTSNIEARICTECKPNIEVVNEYKEPEPIVSSSSYWDGPVLNPSTGVVYGPSGKETYYNLDMTGVISIMRNIGFDSVNYPYWVRSDGCKMLGNYIMVAAALNIHPRGTLVECSLGTAIVCDTGGFAYSNPYQLDVAVTW